MIEKRTIALLSGGIDSATAACIAMEEGQILAIKFVKSNPDWRLSMQTHKWLGVL